MTWTLVTSGNASIFSFVKVTVPKIANTTVAITAGYVNGEDVLGFTNQNGITGSFNASTGVLTLSGTATVANDGTWSTDNLTTHTMEIAPGS